jgi:RNA-directed DNA polymerase
MEYSKINWGKALSELREMQERLVLVYRSGDKREIAQLQRKIVCSFAARAWAVRSVSSNAGGKTPGTDGVIWSTPKERFDGICEV